MKTHLSIALGSVLDVRLAATTELSKKLLLSKGTIETFQMSSAACKGVSMY